jgi:hypothetical protein
MKQACGGTLSFAETYACEHDVRHSVSFTSEWNLVLRISVFDEMIESVRSIPTPAA